MTPPRSLLTAALVALVATTLTGCGDATGVEVADLAGFWNATRLEYTDLSPDDTGFVYDLAAPENGGHLSLDIEASGAFTGTARMPGVTTDPQTGDDIAVPIAGSIGIPDAGTLLIDFDAATEALGLADVDAEFTLVGHVLTFVDEETTFDFAAAEDAAGIGPRGPVAASLTGVLER